jgi:hypothetical protein
VLLWQRVERVTVNLEATESSNRALLSALEDDRKTIGRLSAEHAKGQGFETKLKLLSRDCQDLKQELGHERKKAQAAEARAKKAVDRLGTFLECMD